MTICQGKGGGVGVRVRGFISRGQSVSQQQQDLCGVVREKGIIVEMLLVFLSLTAQLNKGYSSSKALQTGGNSFKSSTKQNMYPQYTLLSRELDVVEQPAVKKGLNGGDGPNIVLVFPSLDEGDESGGVQMLMILWQRWWLCMVQGGVTSVSVHHASGLQPGLLQAGPRGGAPLRLALEQQAHKVPGSSAHTLEVVLREAEVKTTDVQTRLLQTLIQEGRGTAQNNVGHHPC